MNSTEKMHKKILNYLQTKMSIFRTSLTFETLIHYYEQTLTNLSRTLQITTNFMISISTSLFKLFPEKINIEFLLKICLSLIIYSKVIIIFSSYIPVPTIVTQLATEYFDLAMSAYREIIILISGTSVFVKEIILEYRQTESTIALLDDEVKFLRENNMQQQQQIKDLHENGIPKKLHDKDQTHWLNIHEEYQKNITDLQSDLRIQEETNKKLSIQNSELVESIKTSKTTTSVENGQKVVTILGNLSFLGIQLFNAYNAWNSPSQSINPNDIRLLITTVNGLVSRLNLQQVHQTAAQRAEQSARTGAPSIGLTDRDLPFGEEFD